MDCRWVDRCQAYHAVERQHGVAHLTDDPDVNPQDPRIHISLHDLNGGGVGVEWDVRACTPLKLITDDGSDCALIRSCRDEPLVAGSA